MATVNESALKFLNALYEKTGGDQCSIVNSKEIADRLGFDAAKTRTVVSYLVGKRLIVDRQIMDAYPVVDITSHGIDEIERARAHPRNSTTYFPPAINIINVEVMHGGAIQQGTHNSTQNAHIAISPIDLAKLAAELQALREALIASAKSPEHYSAIGAVASAETAAAAGDAGGVGTALKSLGDKMRGWIVDVGKGIGTKLAVEVILKAVNSG